MDGKRPKAISKEGKIGSVSCYVLNDGRCVLAKRTILAELQPGATGSGDLDRYLARLSSKITELELPPVFEFVTPTGQIADGMDDESFSKIIQAYVDGLVLGKLHAQQVPVAQRAYELQKTWAAIGLRAHILSVTGQNPRTVVQQIRSFAERLFRSEPRDWDKRFDNEFVCAVCGVYNWNVEGKRIPRQMRAVFDKLYRLMLSKDGKAMLKARNPDPENGPVRHHQMLSDEMDNNLKSAVMAITYIAKRSGHSVDYFWQQVSELLGVTPIQPDLEPLLFDASHKHKRSA